jgi:hypothetical protein
MQGGGVTTHRGRQKALITDDLVQAGIDGSSASAFWSLRASRDITGEKVIEGVIDEKLFGLCCGDKGVSPVTKVKASWWSARRRWERKAVASWIAS